MMSFMFHLPFRLIDTPKLEQHFRDCFREISKDHKALIAKPDYSFPMARDILRPDVLSRFDDYGIECVMFTYVMSSRDMFDITKSTSNFIHIADPVHAMLYKLVWGGRSLA